MQQDNFKKLLGAVLLFLFHVTCARSQTVYPTPAMAQSYIPPSPNAQSSQLTGNSPVALANGSQSINLPIYNMTCGSLTMPISLSYNYTGFFPLQDAGWVGLGWNLNAGGTISRIVQGLPDGAEPAGFNYNQINLPDSVQQSQDYSAFLSNNYDLAPDIFSCTFSSMSDEFIYYNGKAYQLDYDKRFNATWSADGNSMTVTTTDGTTYLFATTETTSAKTYQVSGDSTVFSYISAWQLSQIVSADKKDTIVLTYTPYTWQQTPVNYQTSYAIANNQGSYPDLGTNPTSYTANPSIQAQILQSISCRTTRVSFIPDMALRTDVVGSYPRLAEIDVIDSLTGHVVKKNTFSYGYFGLTATNPQNVEHLKLNSFASWNTASSNDTLTYRFSYISIGGNQVMPQKTTLGIDDWGYYNGQDGNNSLLPTNTDIYYQYKPVANFSPYTNRNSNSQYSSLFALDTIFYPTGAHTVFSYAGNTYIRSGAVVAGPGICITSAVDFGPNASTPLIARYYSYTADATGQTSGAAFNLPSYAVSSYMEEIQDAPQVGTYPEYYPYTVYLANRNSSGIGGLPPLFYYPEVTEQISSQNEIHKSSYYFNAFNRMFSDAQLVRKVDYKNVPGTTLFTTVKSVSTNYSFTQDTSFFFETPYLSGTIANYKLRPTTSYSYSATQGNMNAYWLRPVSTQTTLYDSTGNSLTTTANYNYNPTTRNLASVQQTTSDGQTLTTKFKYPEDYVSTLTGNMVSALVLSPTLEKEVWLKQDATDSVLISGQVTQYDQTIFKPTATYTLQTTTPIPALNNETTSGGLYSSLLSTSQYALLNQTQFDGNANIVTTNQASDIPVSYIWDYRHTVPIAEANNAASTEIGYTSFEADGTGNVYLGNGGAGIVSTDGVTGTRSYQINNGLAMFNLNPSKTYVVSLWAKNGTPSYNGYNGSTLVVATNNIWTTGKTINGWTYFEKNMTGVSTINVGGGGGLVDEVRFYPANAQMKTYTYTPLIGKSSECDVDNRVTYYQYDGFGRLRVLLDQDHNIIKTYQYHYIGQ